MRNQKIDETRQMGLFVFVTVAEEPPVDVAVKEPVAFAVQQAYEEPAPVREFYRMDETVLDALGGPRSKALANLKAIEILRDVKAARRQATFEEKAAISAYTGWGGLSEVFATNSEHQDIQEKLRELLSPQEYESAMESVLTAYYTEPNVVRAMWKMVKACGFEHGRICEPSVGVGHFIGCMPDDIRAQSRVMAVDIDQLSADLTRALYADSETFVNCTGIEKTSFVDEFDLVIGNVPFGNYRVHDRRLNHLKFSIHEYFVAKSIDMVRVGGLVALIVPSSMLDKYQSSAKKYIAQKAEVIAAIRLPSGAFARLGGTDVVADILVLKKRAVALDYEKVCAPDSRECDFLITSQVNTEYWRKLMVCQHFAKNRELVLGNFEVTHNRFGETNGVKAHDDWSERLDKLAGEVVHQCFDMSGNVKLKSAYRVERDLDPTGKKSLFTPGYFFTEDGRLMAVDERAQVTPQDNLPAATQRRIEGMTRIRDVVLRLLEADSRKSNQAEGIRQELNALYDSFVKQCGFLLTRTNRRLFRLDTHAPLLWSLEHWDEENEVAIKADVFTKSTISTATLPEKADTVEDALALSFNRYGSLNTRFIAQAVGMAAADVIEHMTVKGMAYIDPVSGECVDTSEYLSGNVRVKLEEAKAASHTNAGFLANVKALEAVQPQWLALSQVDTRLGAPWVCAAIVSKWLDETFAGDQFRYCKATVTYLPATATWNCTYANEKMDVFHTEWGIMRKGFWSLLRCLLNQQTPEVFDEIEHDGKTKRVINRDETLACQEKSEMIQRRFDEWLKGNPKISQEVESEYNMRFNAHVNRTYDGSHLVIPGLNSQIQLRAAQKDSIWRGIVSGNTLYALAVGGGKTLIQICVAQEYKRLGLAAKPILVVPNHMLEAFAGEYLRAFPRAKVLAMSKDDMQGERRKTMLMRAATNDWDCIIVTHSTFGHINVSQERIKEYIDEFKNSARESVLGVSDANVVRDASRLGKMVETRLETLASAKRDEEVLGFEDIGIDMILVDEADLFKNLFFFTKKKRIPGISSAFSSRALDLFMKSRLVFEKRGTMRSGLMFATATPISNTIAEMYIMQTYLQEERLQELDIGSFDAWAASFAREVTCVEVRPEGSGYRLHTRFAQFVNVPELMKVFREVAEIRTKAILKLPEPKLKGGGHTIVAVEASEDQKAYVQTLVKRAEDIRQGLVKPNEDNMLCVTGDGRKAALDMRCIDPHLPNDPSTKVNACIRNVFDIWQATADIRATQLVFCDLSVPGTEGFSVYEHIRDSLVSMGVPKAEIAFAQDWSTDAKKAQLHRLVRSGMIRVLVGSTELMGFGTNVQDRLIAKHDLDAPWRPRDVEQRDGRIIRQGCMHDEVVIYRYVTSGTFDAYMWQTLERKAAFIAQVMECDGSVRRVEDVTSQALSFAEVKALASGNPIVIEKAAVDAEVAKLLAIRRVFEDDMANMRWKKNGLERDLAYLRENRVKLQKWLEEANCDAVKVVVDGTAHTQLEEAATAIMRKRRDVQKLFQNPKFKYSAKDEVQLAKVGNLSIFMQRFAGSSSYEMFAQIDEPQGVICLVQLPFATSEIVQYLKDEGMRKQAEDRMKMLCERITGMEFDVKSIEESLNGSFEQQSKLDELLARKAEIDEALEIDADDTSALALAED